MNLAVVMKSLNSKLICRPASVAVNRAAVQRGPLVAHGGKAELVPLQVLQPCYDKDNRCLATPQTLVYVDPDVYHGRIGKRVLTAPGYEEQTVLKDGEPLRSGPVQFVVVDFSDVLMLG